MEYNNQLKIALQQTKVKNLPHNYSKVITFMINHGDITNYILELIVIDLGYSLDEFKALGVKLHYSCDEEDYSLETIDEAVESLLANDASINAGDLVSVYSGEEEPINIREFTPDIIEHMGEVAANEYTNYYDGFPDITLELEKEIQTKVDNFIIEFFESHNLNPNFYKIKNSKKITVKILDADKCEFELVGVNDDQA